MGKELVSPKAEEGGSIGALVESPRPRMHQQGFLSP